jgi:hypothetical protein
MDIEREIEKEREQKKEKIYYETTLSTLHFVLKEKQSLYETKQQLDHQEQECLAALHCTECPNRTSSTHFYTYCLAPNAPCKSLHKEIETIRKQQARYPFQKRGNDQYGFYVLSAAIRHGYMNIIPEIISDDVCNYIDQVDGRTALYDAVKHEQLDIVKQLLPWMKRHTIEVRYIPTKQSVVDIATEEIRACIEKRLQEVE